MARPVLALVDDLIFASRIQAEVERAGGSFRRVGTTKALTEALQNDKPALVIVDLEGMGFDAVAALVGLREVPVADGIRRVAFGSHVDTTRLEAASAAGAEAMARSLFVKRLPDLAREASGRG